MEVGKTYKVTHARKGTFVVEVTGLSPTWMTGVMVDGTTRTMMPENEKGAGEDVTLRISFLSNIKEVT